MSLRNTSLRYYGSGTRVRKSRHTLRKSYALTEINNVYFHETQF